MKNKVQFLTVLTFLLLPVCSSQAEQLQSERVLSRSRIEQHDVESLDFRLRADEARQRRLKLVLFYDAQGAAGPQSAKWSYTISYTIGGSRLELTIKRDSAADALLQSSNSYILPAAVQSFQITGHQDTPTPFTGGYGPAPQNIGLKVIVSEQAKPPDLTIDGFAAGWSTISSAEEYDLEWVYYDARRPPLNNPAYPAKPFAQKQPVRITSKNTAYTLDNMYPRGQIFVRVRAVWLDPPSAANRLRKPGLWSQHQVIPIGGDGFENTRNWQMSVAYNQQGQRTASIIYHDGTFRTRQTVRQVTSKNHVIVSEQKYDREGRSAVEFLPAAVNESTLAYRVNFNRNIDNKAFGAADFEKSAPSRVSNEAGAGKYYSHKNDFTVDRFRDFLPDSAGYPYSIRRYFRDGRDRLRSVSRAGGAFVPQPNRHGRFTYGTVEATRLIKMFGSNAGLSNRHEKLVETDPNGRLQVSYLDQQGRTVATALTGVRPRSLIPLENSPEFLPDAGLSAKMYLNDGNQIDFEASKSRTTARIIHDRESPQTVNFTYTFGGVNYLAGAEGIFPATCLPYSYRLKVVLRSPDGTSKKPVLTAPSPNTLPVCPNPDDGSVKDGFCLCGDTGNEGLCLEYRADAVANPPACGSFLATDSVDRTTPQAERTVIFSAVFDRPGAYVVTKELEVLGMEDALARITPVQSPEDVIDKYRPRADVSICSALVGCDAVCRAQSTMGTAEFDACVSACDGEVSGVIDEYAAGTVTSGSPQCENLKELMLNDISPGGALFENDQWFECAIPAIRRNSDPLALGRDALRLRYPDWPDLSRSLLLRAHPNYARYERCRELSASNRFDASMAAIGSYQEAWQQGFLNPLEELNARAQVPGPPGAPVTLALPPVVVANKDPYFVSSPGSAFRAEVMAEMIDFTSQFVSCPGGAKAVSLWELVSLPAVHPGNPDPVPQDEQWRLFRAIYLGIKHRVEAGRALPAPGCPYNGELLATDAPLGSDTMNDMLSFQTGDDAFAAAFEALESYAESYCSVRVADWLERLDSQRRCSLKGIRRLRVQAKLREYCLDIANESNPLAQVAAADIAANPALVDVKALLPDGCNLDSLIETPAFETRQECATTCCPKFFPSKCVEELRKTVNNMLSAGERSRNFPPGFRKNCISWAKQLTIGADGIAIEGTAQEINRRCTISFIDRDGNRIEIAGLIGIQPLGFSEQMPPVASPFIAGTFTGVTAQLKIRTPQGTDTVEAHLFSDCPLGFARTELAACPDSTGELCKPLATIPDVGIRNPGRPRREIPGPLLGTGGIPAAGSCGNLKAPAGCTREAFDRIDHYIDYRTDQSASDGTCFDVLVAPQNQNHIKLAKKSGTKKECYYRFYTAKGEPLSLARRVTDLIGRPVHSTQLPANFDGSFVPADYKFSQLKIKVRLARAEETVWLYVFSTCPSTFEDWCPELPVQLTFTIPAPVDPGERCRAEVNREAEQNARAAHEDQLQTDTESFRRKFRDHAFAVSGGEGFRENFFYIAKGGEHHFTLYYYDQANLAQTVPPKGARLLDNAQTERHLAIPAAGTQPGPLPEPAHTMLSKFRYDSRHNAICRETPDAGAEQLWYDDAGRMRYSQSARFKQDGVFFYTRYDLRGRVLQTGLIELKQNPGPGTGGTNVTAYSCPQKLPDLLTSNLNDSNFPCDTELGETCDAGQYTLSDKTTIRYDSLPAENAGPGSIKGEIRRCIALKPLYLQGRIAATVRDAGGSAKVTTCYGYDAQGNPAALLQSIPGLDSPKRVDYSYDLAAGNVTDIHFRGSSTPAQAGSTDQFHHLYEYDSDNRLIAVHTSKDGSFYETDAAYKYYKHGPLARLELGANRVQGLDHVYTLRGELKAVNRNTLDTGTAFDVSRDPGRDGQSPAGGGEAFARDAFGFTLGYFQGDYKSIKQAECESSPAGTDCTWNSFEAGSGGSSFAADSPDLFDGNITHQVIANRYFLDQDQGVLGSAYRYDQLNRLVAAKVHRALDHGANTWPSNTPPDGAYDVEVLSMKNGTSVSGYDPNGNIVTMKRNALSKTTSGSPNHLMDLLTYHYPAGNNKLMYIIDESEKQEGGDGVRFGIDLGDQAQDNYAYDADGNLIKDVSEKITNIEWNAYGRVKKINFGAGHDLETIEYLYDGRQNRVAQKKKFRPPSANDPEPPPESLFLVRDATGKLLASYKRVKEDAGAAARDKLSLLDFVLYGSRRLGTVKLGHVLCEFDPPTGSCVAVSGSPGGPAAAARSTKRYELTNHLGNVLLTVSDQKMTRQGSDADGSAVQFYDAQLSNATDYYPYGMEMPERRTGGVDYNFGFNGLERDEALDGPGHYYTPARQYNSRTARWHQPDPLQTAASEPYEGFGSNPVNFVDPSGYAEEPINVIIAEDTGISTTYELIQATAVEGPPSADWTWTEFDPRAVSSITFNFGTLIEGEVDENGNLIGSCLDFLCTQRSYRQRTPLSLQELIDRYGSYSRPPREDDDNAEQFPRMGVRVFKSFLPAAGKDAADEVQLRLREEKLKRFGYQFKPGERAALREIHRATRLRGRIPNEITGSGSNLGRGLYIMEAIDVLFRDLESRKQNRKILEKAFPRR